MWNRDTQCVPLRHKKSSPRTFDGVDPRYRFAGVCVDDIDFPGTADYISEAAFRIVEDLIGIAGDSNDRSSLAGVRGEHDELCWESASDKQAVIVLIQCHLKT